MRDYEKKTGIVGSIIHSRKSIKIGTLSSPLTPLPPVFMNKHKQSVNFVEGTKFSSPSKISYRFCINCLQPRALLVWYVAVCRR